MTSAAPPPWRDHPLWTDPGTRVLIGGALVTLIKRMVHADKLQVQRDDPDVDYDEQAVSKQFWQQFSNSFYAQDGVLKPTEGLKEALTAVNTLVMTMEANAGVQDEPTTPATSHRAQKRPRADTPASSVEESPGQVADDEDDMAPCSSKTSRSSSRIPKLLPTASELGVRPFHTCRAPHAYKRSQLVDYPAHTFVVVRIRGYGRKRLKEIRKYCALIMRFVT